MFESPASVAESAPRRLGGGVPATAGNASAPRVAENATESSFAACMTDAAAAAAAALSPAVATSSSSSSVSTLAFAPNTKS